MDNRKKFKLFGSGVFSTIAVSEGRPIYWEKHWKRLQANAITVGVDLNNYVSDDLLSSLLTKIDKAGLIKGKARLTFYDNRTSEIWPNHEPSDSPTALDILIGERQSAPSELRLSVSSFPVNSRSPLAGVKSCNYLEPILSLDAAKKRGFYEAVRLNERGHITSACMANVFWLKDGELFTPSLTTGCLAGTTREFILENLECSEVEVAIGEIENAEAIFLTSAGLGVVEVAVFNERRMKPSDHQIVDVLPF